MERKFAVLPMFLPRCAGVVASVEVTVVLRRQVLSIGDLLGFVKVAMTHQPKTADEWFDEYGVCHQNATNKLLHWICIPLIMLSLLALIWSIPVPLTISRMIPAFNWAWVLILLSNIFYWRLSKSLAIGMLGITLIMIGVILAYQQTELGSLWVAGLVVFILAWVGQFLGHKIEGAKPAFFDDLKFLLIGPLWLLGFIYRKFGIPY